MCSKMLDGMCESYDDTSAAFQNKGRELTSGQRITMGKTVVVASRRRARQLDHSSCTCSRLDIMSSLV